MAVEGSRRDMPLIDPIDIRERERETVSDTRHLRKECLSKKHVLVLIVAHKASVHKVPLVDVRESSILTFEQ